MLHPKKPNDYITELEVAACMVEYKGEILLLQQAPHKNSPGEWLEPGGKIDPGETPEKAMTRELKEETGITIKIGEATHLFKKYFYFLKMNITIDFYYIVLDYKPQVIICDEHSDYRWISPKNGVKINLIEDLDEILREIYGIYKKNSLGVLFI